jgi:predicted amidohydrolase YtcJ
VAARLTAYIVAVIVGVTFIAGLIVGAQRKDEGPVDVMVVNGHVYTADGNHTSAEAVAIQGNKILRVGTTREIQRMRRAQTMVIDAKGGAVLPGFIESDINFLAEALIPPPSDAAEPIELPPPTRGEKLAALRAAIDNAHRHGVTSVQTSTDSVTDLDLYDELRREEALALRVYGAMSVAADATSSELDALDALRDKYSDDPLFKAGVVELEVDGPVTRLVTELDRRGWQIVLHADSDRDVTLALESFEGAAAANPAPARGRRNRIDVDMIGPVDFARFEPLGIVPPPAAPTSWQQAIDAITRFAAWMSFDDQRKGSLAPDMLADVVVLSKNIGVAGGDKVTDADVAVTIFDGKVVYQTAEN